MSEPEPPPINDALSNPKEAPPMADPGDTRAELRQRERPPLPPGCPVKPLGIASDIAGQQRCFYLNFNGQLVGLEANNRHGKLGLIGLFGPESDWLETHFPQWSKPIYEGRGAARVCIQESEIVGFDQAEAARAMVEECCRKGIFDPAGKMRGAGAHRQRAGGIVLHCGDKLLVSRHFATTGELRDTIWIDPGLHEGFVYTAAAPLPRPDIEEAHPRCAEKLLATLMTWHWKRPLLDARFVLGAIGASLVGGWLPWRPNIWITGNKSTGKSTLNGERGLLDGLFGTGQFRTSNASAASIRQSLQNSTVPVMFDELEPGPNNSRQTEVMELARVASSGGTMHRGGQDHSAHEFTLRSAFWFSSINIPPLTPQDRSRLAIVELRALPRKAVPPDLAAMNLPRLGQQLLRRMVDGLGRIEATKLKYHAALAGAGHDSRACDQFGTLLACADVLLHDWPTPDEEEIAHWASECRPDRMAEISEQEPEQVECLHHILTSEVQARGGDEREALGTWIGKAVAFVANPHLDRSDPRAGDDRADRRLQQVGLKLVNAKLIIRAGDGAPARWGSVPFDPKLPGFLAVANNHQALARLFAGQRWQGGVWKQSLGRFEGAIEGIKVRFAHSVSWSILVPLWQVLDEAELPEPSRREACAAWIAAQEKGGEA